MNKAPKTPIPSGGPVGGAPPNRYQTEGPVGGASPNGYQTQSLAERLAALPRDQRDQIIRTFSSDEQAAITYAWRAFWARPDQLAPESDWAIWLVLAGRGFGKTRTGAEWIRERVEAGARRIALVAETAADARDVMVEGESGLLKIYPPENAPIYEPSKRRITWPNGAIATLYNATEPDQLRGPQHDTAWCDELAKWKRARETWDQLQFGMRQGDPRIIVTTTPRPIELVKALVAGTEGRVVVTRGRTADNQANLAPGFIERIEGRYAGTRLGRQELEGEILGDIPGALWRLADIDAYRILQPQSRLVNPQGGSHPGGDRANKPANPSWGTRRGVNHLGGDRANGFANPSWGTGRGRDHPGGDRANEPANPSWGTRRGTDHTGGEVANGFANPSWGTRRGGTPRMELERIVVAVDPAVTAGDESNESGVIVAGVARNEGYVLEDASSRSTPLQWARKAIALYDKYEADAIVIETNQGGDMVKHTLESVRRSIRILEVRASRGKHIRAEPVAALYEQGRIHHVGTFPELENQMCQMTAAGYEGEGSPDRLDALVWAFSELFPRLTSRTHLNGVSLRAQTDFKVF